MYPPVFSVVRFGCVASIATGNMADNEVQVEGQRLENSPSGQDSLADPQKANRSGEEPGSSRKQEVGEAMRSLADHALAPPSGAHVPCRSQEARQLERSVLSIQLQFQFLKRKADDLQEYLVKGQGNLKREALPAAVLSLLHTCQPYFNHLEFTARSTRSHHNRLPADIASIRRVQLLEFSQQLCDHLEELLWTLAGSNLLCLDESQPHGVSHFCIGEVELGQLKLTIYRYCKPTPYLAQVDTGLYKRMRWNVKRIQDSEESDEDGEETVAETDYYFLCYEEKRMVSDDAVVRMWFIGQWVQVYPDPESESEDIYGWILCDVPRAEYRKLVFLGYDEPSNSRATDCLQQLLLSS